MDRTEETGIVVPYNGVATSLNMRIGFVCCIRTRSDDVEDVFGCVQEYVRCAQALEGRHLVVFIAPAFRNVLGMVDRLTALWGRDDPLVQVVGFDATPLRAEHKGEHYLMDYNIRSALYRLREFSVQYAAFVPHEIMASLTSDAVRNMFVMMRGVSGKQRRCGKLHGCMVAHVSSVLNHGVEALRQSYYVSPSIGGNR
jgi:hypothetical protein